MASEQRSGASTQSVNEFLLEVRNLSVDYHVNSEAARRAINRLSFEISPGEVVGILGESGSGKSTLAHALLGLLPRNARIRAGSVLFRGLDLLRLRQGERIPSRSGNGVRFPGTRNAAKTCLARRRPNPGRDSGP